MARRRVPSVIPSIEDRVAELLAEAPPLTDEQVRTAVVILAASRKQRQRLERLPAA